MYLQYYGLSEAPFDITPNPRFLFYSAKHREAFNHLLYGIRERKGFVQLTGEVGAGKTTLCRAMLEQLDGHYATALILNPVMSAEELVKAIAVEFGLPVNGLDRLDTLAVINQFLLQQVERGQDTVLIIDEAQDLTDELTDALGYARHGVLITAVEPDSPADQAGLERGLVIYRLSESEVNSVKEMEDLLRRARSGTSVELVVGVIRADGQAQRVETVTLAAH